MRLIKMLSLSSLGAVAVLALVGAPSAMAEGSTALCKKLEEPCQAENLVTGVEFTNSVPFDLKNGYFNVLCLSDFLEVSALGLGEPQSIHVVDASLTKCGTNSAHNNCTYTTEELPLIELLRTAEDRGVLQYLSGVIRVQCVISGFLDIDCKYDQTGLEYEIVGGKTAAFISAEGAPASLTGGSGLLCPPRS